MPGTDHVDAPLIALALAMADDDAAVAVQLLAASPALAKARIKVGASRHGAKAYCLQPIGHYMYAGDTALHIAAAAYRHDLIGRLIEIGADIRAQDRRGAEPLHYAAMGSPGSSWWNPLAQVKTIAGLIEAGADPNAVDMGGVTPLHRAVRTRCAAAVRALLDGGADAKRNNKNGSTPMRLATQTTGRGGSGSPEAKAEQAEIMRLLEQHGAKR
jgi:hypothetical protein